MCCEFDNLAKLSCKFDELDKLNCNFDELAKVSCKFAELDNSPIPHRPRIPRIAANRQILGFWAESYSVREDLT